VPKDAKTAVSWFQKAAELNFAPGQFNLGFARLMGDGIAQDEKEATRLLLASANQGFGPSMYVLAEVLRKSRNPQAAFMWALLAEAQEVKGADKLVEQLTADLSASQQDEGKRQAAAWRPKKAGEEAAPDLRHANDDEVGSTKAKPAATTTGGGDRLVATGTGFFVSSSGHIVTNHHVIDGCSRLDAGTNGSGKFPAQVVGDDIGNDLAVLKIATAPKSFASFRMGQIRQAEGVMAYGFPLTGALSSESNATSGNITALTELRDDSRFSQMSAPVQPGNSGGPLLDMGGNVVGVVVSKMDALRVAKVSGDIPQNVNFAIKSSVATNFLESHGVQFTTNSLGSEKSNPDIGEQAKGFSVLVGCYK
jgi:S1-C subfamily serine protease